MEKINLGFSVSNSNSPSHKSNALTLNQTIDLIKNALKEKYNSSEITMFENIDKNILGGIKIKIGDTVYEDTIQRSLRELQMQLTQ